MQKGKKFLSDLKLYSDYFKWREELGRYENWQEACEDIINGHRKKYDGFYIDDYLMSALESMQDQAVLASQRNLQYRHPEIMRHNTRMFNCTSTHIMRNRVFQEVFYLGLSGCGVGGGLLIPFVNNISRIQKRTLGTKTFVVPDSIEGWADALGVLMSSYFVDKQPFPEYAGYEIKFDYSQIREKGTFINGGFKAPGPDGLKQSLEKIEQLIERWIEKEGNKIRPILAFDIICHASDAVLSGGVRRSALNMIVDPNDKEMIHAKVGNWRTENPQRARSNNSVLLLRGKVTKEEFEYLVKLNEGDSDIGFLFANSWFDMFNPCFEILKLPILDNIDFSKIDYEDVEHYVKNNESKFGVQGCNLTEINAEKATTKEKFFKACKDASILGTLQAGYNSFPYLGEVSEKIFAREALLGVSITGWMNNPTLFNAELLREGAEVVKQTNKELAQILGINQAARTTCVKPSGNASVVLGTASGIHPEHSERYFRIMQLNKESNTAKWLNDNMQFLLEDSVWSQTNSDYVVFVPVENPKKGLFKKDMKGIKHLELIKLVQQNWVNAGTNPEQCVYNPVNHNTSCFTGDVKFLTDEGVVSFDEIKNKEYVNVLNKNGNFSKSRVYNHGKQEIYELILGKGKLRKVINTTENHKWFIKRKWDRTSKGKEFVLETKNLEYGMKISSVDFDEFPEFNLDAFLHGVTFGDGTYHKGNDNCQTYLFDDSRCLHKYFELGGYSVKIRENDIRVHGLPNHWKKLPDIKTPDYIRSFIAGWFAADGHISKDGKTISISSVESDNLDWLQKNSCIGKVIVNQISQHKFGENPYSKSEYFYTITLNKDSLNDDFFKHDKKYDRWINYLKNKTQKSKKWKVLSVKKTNVFEDVYCVEEPITNGFVLEGNILTHNCTVIIDDKESIINYIWDNREDFTAVSFISDYGDKDFNQAPFTSVLTLEELVAEYGKGAVLASGLVVDGLHYFENNLWQACDTLINMGTDYALPITGTREQVLLKKYWLDRAKKFAKNYFKGDLRKMVYCLKDVHLFHKWETVTRQFREVNFGEILDKPQFKDISDYGAISCSGGSCEIVRI